MTTLLIDADFRRAALGPLFDFPECRGLSDALADRGPDPAGLLVSVQGGIFQVLCAGTPVRDTCRLLRSRKLGSIIAGFRETYEVIIIDSPPVLPVPDALVFGAWADRALFRRAIGRQPHPQVKAALHRLDRAGIAVPAIVLNGVREHYGFYGLYPYTPRSTTGITGIRGVTGDGSGQTERRQTTTLPRQISGLRALVEAGYAQAGAWLRAGRRKISPCRSAAG